MMHKETRVKLYTVSPGSNTTTEKEITAMLEDGWQIAGEHFAVDEKHNWYFVRYERISMTIAKAALRGENPE